MRVILYFIIILFGTACFSQTTELSGKITAEGKPVPFANVYIENSGIGTTSDENGDFRLKNIPENSRLIISAIGFKPLKVTIPTENGVLRQDFTLEFSSDELQEILIIDEQSGLTRRTPYNVSSINMQGIQNKGNPNGMMGILREVPGIYGAEFGQGIVKPFIRGLGFSRIVTIYQGNKLENHQWGADHGLGINDLGIKQIEIIKGPASVLYGSGALGGVLLAKDDDFYLRKKQITGNLGTTYNSVSNGIRTYASLGKTFDNKIFFATDLAYENHADYTNGDNRIIGNSRFNITTFRLHTGIEKESFQNKLSLTSNHQKLGIISDEEMDDVNSLATTANDRKMQLPYQEVDDYLISYNQSTQNNNFETSLHLSHHLNERKEIESGFGLVDLGLNQNHTFYNGRLSFPTGKMEHSIGIQGSYLQNRNMPKAQDFLIPDAETLENGFYYLAGLNLESYFIQGALRYDHRKVTADASADHFVEYGFILPGDPESKNLSRKFGGFTGSLGITRKNKNNHQFKLNFSTGFRAPDLAELFSNGPHPGTSRFEKGNDNFEREQSLQVDFNYNYSKRRFDANVSAFGNLIDNYIYFSATNEARPQDDLEIWAYQQANARFFGLEFELKHSWLKENRLKSTLSGAVVRATDRETGEYLTFIPPDNYNLEIIYYALSDRSLSLFSKIRLVNEQNRTGVNEENTAGYHLLNFGGSKNFVLGNNSLDAGITAYNVLNETYVDHMSILRAFNISSPGRNIMLNLKFNF